MSDQVVLTTITTLGGIIVTYLTLKYKHRVLPTIKGRPKEDRMERMFDGYERLIKAKDTEAERLMANIHSLETTIHRLKMQVENTEELLDATKEEMARTKEENQKLREDLREFRNEYRKHKT